MKFEKITDNKIKISLTSEDMDMNNISKNILISDNFIAHPLLQSFLERAEQELNFKVNDENLLVEILNVNDGFIFTITKVNSDYLIYDNSHFVYKFENFNNFLAFCTYIKNMNWSVFEDFCLFIYNNVYFLISSNNISPDFNFVLSEFGKKINSSYLFEGILNEYGKVILGRDAINTCINLFVR